MRERLGDLLRITGHYLEFFSAQCKKPVKAFTPRAAEAMQRYSWPGNLRELRNLVERAVILATGELIDLADLPEKMRDSVAASPDGQLIRVGGRFSLEELEGEHIRQLLAKTDTMEEASKILGIDPGNALPQAKENFSPIGIAAPTRRLSRCSWIYNPLHTAGKPGRPVRIPSCRRPGCKPECIRP